MIPNRPSRQTEPPRSTSPRYFTTFDVNAAVDGSGEDGHPCRAIRPRLGPVRRGLPSSEQGLVRMAVRRTNSRGWVLPTRVLAIAGLLALLGAGCGQIGGTHGSTGGTVPAAYVAPDARPPAGQTPHFVAAPCVSGNPSTFGS